LQRIAVPMNGGMVSSTVLTLVGFAFRKEPAKHAHAAASVRA
jgi:Cu/Ag efflux pump CusA